MNDNDMSLNGERSHLMSERYIGGERTMRGGYEAGGGESTGGSRA